MTFKELFNKFETEKNNAVLTVKKPVFEDMYLSDKGMKGILIGMDNHSNTLTDEEFDIGMYVLKINCDPYREANKSFLESNYYDSNRQPILTAEEAGMYPTKGIESVYVMGNQTVEEFFDIEFVGKDYDRKEKIKTILLNGFSPYTNDNINEIVNAIAKI